MIAAKHALVYSPRSELPGHIDNTMNDERHTGKKTTTPNSPTELTFFELSSRARALHSPAQAASWRALEAELVNHSLLHPGLWLIVPVLQPYAPRALRKAGIGGVVLAPLDHELLEATAALLPHPGRSVRLHRRE